MGIYHIILILGGCVGVAMLLLLLFLCIRKCHQNSTDIEQNNVRTVPGRVVVPSVRVEDEKRKGQPLMPIQSAIRKHIYPNCRTAIDAVNISIQRNKQDPTEVNTVFQAQPTQFHLEIQNGEEVGSNKQVI